jgi:nicotinamide-nucleotide amidase
MKIELLSIGDELLKGMTVNTNTAFICRALQERGYRVAMQTTLPDHTSLLAEGMQDSLKRADLVIATGGLGPTLDDLTRSVAASCFSSPFHVDKTVAADLRKRYGEKLASLQDQATIPSKAHPLLNRVGTAPGLIFSEGKKTLILLPGVPQEMQPMLQEQVIPWIETHFPLKHKNIPTLLFFSLLPENKVDPELRTLQERYPEVEVGIYPAYGTLTVSLCSSDRDALKCFKEALEKRFHPYLFTSSHGKIEEAVHAWFIKHGKTLAFAESCTGGLMAAQVTALPGASDYFLGSLVTYSNALKTDLLGVSKHTLQQYGAVSEEVVREMLEGVFRHTAADVGIAVTGIAGPTGGSDAKPIGTIWAAMGERGKSPDVGTFQLRGSRQTVTLLTSQRLLGALHRKMAHGIPAFPLF